MVLPLAARGSGPTVCKTSISLRWGRDLGRPQRPRRCASCSWTQASGLESPATSRAAGGRGNPPLGLQASHAPSGSRGSLLLGTVLTLTKDQEAEANTPTV